MFDLKYYKELLEKNKSSDEYKGRMWSKQNLHEKKSELILGKKQLINNLVEDLPQTNLKDILRVYCNKKGIGERALQELLQ